MLTIHLNWNALSDRLTHNNHSLPCQPTSNICQGVQREGAFILIKEMERAFYPRRSTTMLSEPSNFSQAFSNIPQETTKMEQWWTWKGQRDSGPSGFIFCIRSTTKFKDIVCHTSLTHKDVMFGVLPTTSLMVLEKCQYFTESMQLDLVSVMAGLGGCVGGRSGTSFDL